MIIQYDWSPSWQGEINWTQVRPTKSSLFRQLASFTPFHIKSGTENWAHSAPAVQIQFPRGLEGLEPTH